MNKMETEYEKITFKDLSTPLKIVVVFAWLSISMNILLFIAGFLMYQEETKMDITTQMLYGGAAIVNLCIALIMFALLQQAIKDKSIMERKYIKIVENLTRK